VPKGCVGINYVFRLNSGSVERNIRQYTEPVQSVAQTTKGVLQRAPNDISQASDVVNVVLANWRERLSDTLGSINSRVKGSRGSDAADEEIDETGEKKTTGKRKLLAQDRVASALSAAESAAAQAEVASGRLQEAMEEYDSLSSFDEYTSNS